MRPHGLLMTFAAAMLLILVLGCHPTSRKPRAKASQYSVSVLSSMVKIRRDEHRPGRLDQELELHAARGEAESAQLLIQADQSLKGVTVSAASLLGPQGASLPLEILRVGYVPIKNPTPVGFGKPGPYPDPLLPLLPFDVKAGESQALWVTAWVPRDAPAGDYRGEITILPVSAPPQSLKVRLRVYSVTLPVQSALRTNFLSWNGGASDEWYGKVSWEKLKPHFLDSMLRYRLSYDPELPWFSIFRKKGNGAWSAEWAEFDRAVEDGMSKGISFFMIRRQILPWYGGREVSANVPDTEEAAAKLRLFGNHLKAKGWADRFAFYLFDEAIFSDDVPKPGDRTGSANIKNIKALAQLVHDHAPDLRVMIVACDPAYEAVAREFPAYIWCPHINHFHAGFQQRRRRMGEPSWMYVCMTTRKQAYPDIWRIDREGVSHRAIGSWLWRNRCDGFLFWCVDYWRKNPYETPDIFAKGVNGDGFLFYPDPEKRADPFPSIRLALTRDAFEDYDLFSLLQQAVTSLRDRGDPSDAYTLLLSRAASLLDLGTLIPAADRFAEDPAAYENRHREVLEVLQALDLSRSATLHEREKRREQVLIGMRRVMGPLPDASKRVPLDWQTEDTVRLAKVTRMRISFAAEPGDRVSACLLIPNALTEKAPAVLCLHQTTDIGKDEPAGVGGRDNLHYAMELSERGYVTLAPDYPNFGGYRCDPYKLGYASATMKGIWNHMRAVDLLQSLAEVDPARIGCVGHSLGGHNTLFLAAFDVRIKALVSSCGFTSFSDYYGGNLAGWSHPGYMPRIASVYGNDPKKMPFDFTEIISALAPRPLFINAPLGDRNFNVSGVSNCVAAARPVYELLGARDSLVVMCPAGGHDFPRAVREAAYAFLDKALKPKPEASVAERLKIPVMKDAGYSAYGIVDEQIMIANRLADDGFAKCPSPEAFKRRQEDIRERWLAALGGFPARTPLNPAIGETVSRKGYDLTKILYESQPGLFVTALLYKPTAPGFKAPHPALLIPCGHAPEGKAFPPYQRAGLLAAQAGFVALCYDPIDQGERVQLAEPGAPSGVEGHNRLGVRAVLLGWNTARFHIWDGIRGIDYLTSLPEVDASRIGVMGHSGGGTLTTYLMNADPRVKTAAPACYITRMPDLFDRTGPHDAEQNIFGQLAFGLNHAAYLVLRAPDLSVCVNSVHDDFFPFSETLATLATAQQAYARLGVSDIPLSAPRFDSPLGFIDVPGTHAWTEGMLQGSLLWMRAKLSAELSALPYDIKTLRDISVKTEVKTVDCGLAERETWVTPAGKVRYLTGNRTAYDIQRDELARIDEKRQPVSRTQRQKLIREALHLNRYPVEAPSVSVLSESDCGTYREIRETLRVNAGFGVSNTVPAIMLIPREIRGAPALIVAQTGKGSMSETARACLAEGCPVMAADLFATGEIGLLKPGHYNFDSTNTNESAAMMLYLLGRSALEFRTRDCLGCAYELSRRVGGQPVKVLAQGNAVIAAYHAYAVAPDRFSNIVAKDPPPSWREAVHTTTPYRFSDCLHNGLRMYDWVDLYR